MCTYLAQPGIHGKCGGYGAEGAKLIPDVVQRRTLFPAAFCVTGFCALTFLSCPDIFFEMKLTILTLLFLGLLACTARNGSAPDERQLAHVVLEVIHLHQRYAEHPDSLAMKRRAVLEEIEFTRKDLERLTATWKTNPEALDGLSGSIMETLEADSVFVHWKKTEKRKTTGGRRRGDKKR